MGISKEMMLKDNGWKFNIGNHPTILEDLEDQSTINRGREVEENDMDISNEKDDEVADDGYGPDDMDGKVANGLIQSNEVSMVGKSSSLFGRDSIVVEKDCQVWLETDGVIHLQNLNPNIISNSDKRVVDTIATIWTPLVFLQRVVKLLIK
ncbi:hypothetical protein F0562_013905 [Nyssa sinensis]|uniref:Uncharacterized protein n=1 Tax=Nyssa sinensis TaxID=561372 RepID=A0A5J4ZLY5_9ASTE|nr:hypothetical protein F0562_013905 [Nyssa sinensis]